MNRAGLTEARVLFAKVRRVSQKLKKTDTVICPPFVYVSSLNAGKSERFLLGAQDAFWQSGGRFTGEVSPEMLKGLDVSYVIVGHSERRALGETDEAVSNKALAGLREGLAQEFIIQTPAPEFV